MVCQRDLLPWRDQCAVYRTVVEEWEIEGLGVELVQFLQEAGEFFDYTRSGNLVGSQNLIAVHNGVDFIAGGFQGHADISGSELFQA